MEIFGIGLPELIVILLILLLLFGATRLPKLSKSAGETIREFKKGIKETGDEISKDDKKAKDNKDTKNS